MFSFFVSFLFIGFKALICKDFNSFGHMFRHRSGLVDEQESSPIFLQFLDCVWQIWRQAPWEFEFTETLLTTLLFSLSSRYTHDFVFDNDKERSDYLKVITTIVRETYCEKCRQGFSKSVSPGSFINVISC